MRFLKPNHIFEGAKPFRVTVLTGTANLETLAKHVIRPRSTSSRCKGAATEVDVALAFADSDAGAVEAAQPGCLGGSFSVADSKLSLHDAARR